MGQQGAEKSDWTEGGEDFPALLPILLHFLPQGDDRARPCAAEPEEVGARPPAIPEFEPGSARGGIAREQGRSFDHGHCNVGAVCLTPAGAEVQRLAVRRPDGTLAANAFFYLVL